MVTIEWSDEDEAYIAQDNTRPGCCADGPTELLAFGELQCAREAWDEAATELGRPIPVAPHTK